MIPLADAMPSKERCSRFRKHSTPQQQWPTRKSVFLYATEQIQNQ